MCGQQWSGVELHWCLVTNDTHTTQHSSARPEKVTNNNVPSVPSMFMLKINVENEYLQPANAHVKDNNAGWKDELTQ